MSPNNNSILIAKNPQFDIKIIENFIAGIVLTGNEIKSLRKKDVSIRESYVLTRDGEAHILNMYISSYKNANYSTFNSNDNRIKRKLLLKKSEIRKISKFVKEKSCVIIPIKVFISNSGWAKLEIVVAQKLRKYQIKEKLKEKEKFKEMIFFKFINFVCQLKVLKKKVG